MEAAQVEQYNRFKELQKEYSKSFNYKLYNQELRVHCRSCYLPFEARMDQETFELFLLNSNPKDVVLLGFSNQSLEKTKNFCSQNEIGINLHIAPMINRKFISSNQNPSQSWVNSFKMNTSSAVKNVLIDELLYKYLPLQNITGVDQQSIIGKSY